MKWLVFAQVDILHISKNKFGAYQAHSMTFFFVFYVIFATEIKMIIFAYEDEYKSILD